MELVLARARALCFVAGGMFCIPGLCDVYVKHEYTRQGYETKCGTRGGQQHFTDSLKGCQQLCDDRPNCLAFDVRPQDGHEERVFYCTVYFRKSLVEPYTDAATVGSKCFIKDRITQEEGDDSSKQNKHGDSDATFSRTLKNTTALCEEKSWWRNPWFSSLFGMDKSLQEQCSIDIRNSNWPEDSENDAWTSGTPENTTAKTVVLELEEIKTHFMRCQARARDTEKALRKEKTMLNAVNESNTLLKLQLMQSRNTVKDIRVKFREAKSQLTQQMLRAKEIHEQLERAKSHLAQRDSSISDLRKKLEQAELKMEEGEQELGTNKWITHLVRSHEIVASLLKKRSDKADALEVRLTELLDRRIQPLEQQHADFEEQYPSAATVEMQTPDATASRPFSAPLFAASGCVYTLLIALTCLIALAQCSCRFVHNGHSRPNRSHVEETRTQQSILCEHNDSEMNANVSEAGSFRLVYNRVADLPIAEFQEDIGCSQSSDASSDSWLDLGSTVSSANPTSWVSAPAKLGAPRCFLPRTCFQLPEGGRITAAQLQRCGGDIVLSPDGSEVRVQQSLKQPATERDIVQFHMEGIDHPFMVTSDHRIKMELHDGMETIEEARALLDNLENNDMRVFHGLEPRRVTAAKLVRTRTEVVEVTFVDDKTVLAWLPPGRRPRSHRPPSLGCQNAVACRGAPMETHDRMRRDRVQIKNTFLDDARNGPKHRSLSAGDLPRTPVWFSKGSMTHKQAEPGQCEVCPTHHRQLLKPSASPCQHGEMCRLCHMPHDELRFRFRP